MKSYLFVFNKEQATRRFITSRLDSLDEVVNWMAFFPNAVSIVSDVDAAELSRVIRRAIPNVQFIVVALEKGNKNGWLPKSIWEFVNHPSRVDAESAA